MNPTIVIPTYWADGPAEFRSPGAYDHVTPTSAGSPELAACLSSLEQVRHLPRVIILVVCPLSATDDVVRRIQDMLARRPAIRATLVTNHEVPRVQARVAELAPGLEGEVVSLRGYGAIRNMGLAAAAILGHDAVVFLDDDEVVLGPDFMDRALYGLNQETRQRLPILAKSGYFFDKNGLPLADTTKKAGITNRWWTKRIEFNRWMSQALKGTRISRSNYLCGGCFALHLRAFARVAFDPYITRGEDIDYLFNMRMFGLDVWFDNTWAVKHLPPSAQDTAPRFLQNVYRWYYEREKLRYAQRRPDLAQVTPASLMPYPGPWISDELDDRVRKTAIVRTLFTREHRGYLYVWRRGIAEAQAYARENRSRYLRFETFWPSIVNGLWCDAELARLLEQRSMGDGARAMAGQR